MTYPQTLSDRDRYWPVVSLYLAKPECPLLGKADVRRISEIRSISQLLMEAAKLDVRASGLPLNVPFGWYARNRNYRP